MKKDLTEDQKRELREEIDRLTAEKELAVKAQDWNRAADLRDRADDLLTKLVVKTDDEEENGLPSLFSWPKDVPYTIDDWNGWAIDSFLCEKMGWTGVDSPDGLSLRGFHPRTGTHKYIKGYQDAFENGVLRQVLLWGVKCKDGSPLYYETGGAIHYPPMLATDPRVTKGFWARFRHHKATSPSSELEWFESGGWSVELATARAAVKVLKVLPVELPDWYIDGRKKRKKKKA